MNKEKIWLSSPHMGGNEIKYINTAFETNWIAPLGPNVNGFEKDLQDYLNIKNAAVLSSGTAAIHLALILLNVGYGDEVICQSFTFSATANPIVYQGATPVFVDSESATWNMCPQQLKMTIEDRLRKGKKPKAIIPVHLYGMPAKMIELAKVAQEYNIPIIEDAAEALGSKYFDQFCGTFGEFGILSFNGNKIITTSGGGALISSDGGAIEKARFLSTQARDSAPHYQHTYIGYNYRMSNIAAGIGRGQMEVLNDHIQKRRYVYDYYLKSLSGLPGIKFLSEDAQSFSNRWLTCIVVDPVLSGGITREHIRIHLESENIESRPLWKPMHLQPVFSDAPYYGNNVSESLFQSGLCLPSGSNLSVQDLDRVIQAISSLFQ